VRIRRRAYAGVWGEGGLLGVATGPRLWVWRQGFAGRGERGGTGGGGGGGEWDERWRWAGAPTFGSSGMCVSPGGVFSLFLLFVCVFVGCLLSPSIYSNFPVYVFVLYPSCPH